MVSSDGKYYKPLVEALNSYGVEEKDITFVNYFKDTDVILFLEGLADKLSCRLEEKQVINEIQNFSGIIIGFSAGAMVQIQDFHITEDEDYPNYTYHFGLNLINSFDIEVHYEKGNPIMEAAIQRCLLEKKDIVYGIEDFGAIIVEDNYVNLLGDVSIFQTERLEKL